jgi:hypothetical protein
MLVHQPSMDFKFYNEERKPQPLHDLGTQRDWWNFSAKPGGKKLHLHRLIKFPFDSNTLILTHSWNWSLHVYLSPQTRLWDDWKHFSCSRSRRFRAKRQNLVSNPVVLATASCYSPSECSSELLHVVVLPGTSISTVVSYSWPFYIPFSAIIRTVPILLNPLKL